MPEDRRMTISSSSPLSPDEVARRTFATARRGYAPDEVRAYLDTLAQSLRGTAEREHDLRRALEDAEHRAANPVLDEETLAASLGQETSRVLKSAHEAAHEMVGKATAEAERLLAEAHAEIAATESRVSEQLADRVAQTDAATAEARRRAEDESAAALDRARSEAEALVDEARVHCRDMVEEAQALRARVLADLSRRRKVLHAQIEQLRAGREHLAETVRAVRRDIDSIADDLFKAEDEARLAAEAAGREAVSRPDEGTPEELAASLLAEEAASPADDLVPSSGDVFEAPVDEYTVAVEEVAVEVGAPTEVVIADAATASGDRVTLAAPFDQAAPVDDVDTAETPAVTLPKGLGPRPEPEPEATAAAAPEAADEPGPVDGDGEGPAAVAGEEAAGDAKPSVDDLFAKIRAARGEGDGEVAADGGAGSAATTDEAGPEGAEATDGEDEDGEDAPPEDRDPRQGRRDDLVAPIVKALARRMKRTLQDDQNDILDRLRSNHSVWSPEVLPEEPEHHDAYSTAALPYLEEAAQAGASFVGSEGASGPSVDLLLGIAHELAETVVGPLRRRLADDERLQGAGESEVAEHVGSAFRDWKGARVESLAGDFVVAAFSAGSIAGATGEPGTLIEWVAVAGPDAGPCPDCEDNALNGPQQPGEDFPTGHARPPVHPGCRCLLALAAT